MEGTCAKGERVLYRKAHGYLKLEAPPPSMYDQGPSGLIGHLEFIEDGRSGEGLSDIETCSHDCVSGLVHHNNIDSAPSPIHSAACSKPSEKL